MDSTLGYSGCLAEDDQNRNPSAHEPRFHSGNDHECPFSARGNASGKAAWPHGFRPTARRHRLTRTRGRLTVYHCNDAFAGLSHVSSNQVGAAAESWVPARLPKLNAPVQGFGTRKSCRNPGSWLEELVKFKIDFGRVYTEPQVRRPRRRLVSSTATIAADLPVHE